VKPALVLPPPLAAAALALFLAAPHSAAAQGVDVPYVPTPQIVVEEMLRLANVGPQDFVIDLGSGDGRIVIAAAKRHGARGFGVDVDGALVSEARREARRQGVADRVEFKTENLFLTEIDRATVLTLYLFPSLMMRLRPQLIAQLKPGTRVVSHDFDMGGWRADTQLTVPVPDKPHGPPRSEVYLWIVPANAAGTWRWRSTIGSAEVDCELALSQAFQELDGSLLLGGKPGRFADGRMRGAEIRFALIADVDGRALRHEFSGRVNGDAISGIVKPAGRGQLDWKATRVQRGSIDTSSDQ
jgi:hypothetical protein